MGVERIMGLTQRESEVVTLLAKGRKPKEIAAELCLQRGTIKMYLQRARDKTGSKTTYELIAKAANEIRGE